MIKIVKAGFGFVLVLLGGLVAGCGTSPLLEGNEAFHEGEFAVAEARWMPMAEAGNSHAQHNLGILNKTLGDLDTAAYWWEQAAARDFVPSMVELGALRLAAGDEGEAEALYRRAARWGSADAIAVLEAREVPVPYADLLFARMQRLQIYQTRLAWSRDRGNSAADLQEAVDQAAVVAEND